MYLILIATAFLGSIAFSLLLRRLDRNSRQVAQMKKSSQFYEQNLSELVNRHCERIKDSVLEYELLVNQSHQAEGQLRRSLDEYRQQMEQIREEGTLIDQLSQRLNEMAGSAQNMGDQVEKMEEGLQKLAHARQEIDVVHNAVEGLKRHTEQQEFQTEATLKGIVEQLAGETEKRLLALVENARSALEALQREHRNFQERLHEQAEMSEGLAENVSAISDRLDEKWDLESSRIGERQNELERRFKGRIESLEQGLSEIRKTAVQSLQEEIARMRAELEDFNLQALSRRDEILNETKRMAAKVQEQVGLFQEKYIEVENRFLKSTEAHEESIQKIIESYDQKWSQSQGKRIEESSQKILALEEEIEQIRKQEWEGMESEAQQISEQLQKQGREIGNRLEAQETEGIRNLRELQQSEERRLQTTREELQHLKSSLSQQGQELRNYIRSETEHATELIHNARNEEEEQIMQGLKELEQIRAEQHIWIRSAQEQLDKAMELQKNLEIEINRKKGGLSEHFSALQSKLGEQFLDHRQEADEYFSKQVNRFQAEQQQNLASLKEQMDEALQFHRRVRSEIDHNRETLDEKAAQLSSEMEEKFQSCKQNADQYFGSEVEKLEERFQMDRQSLSEYCNRRHSELQENFDAAKKGIEEERREREQILEAKSLQGQEKITHERQEAIARISDQGQQINDKLAMQEQKAIARVSDQGQQINDKLARQEQEAIARISDQGQQISDKIADQKEEAIGTISEQGQEVSSSITRQEEDIAKRQAAAEQNMREIVEEQLEWKASSQEQLEQVLQAQERGKAEIEELLQEHRERLKGEISEGKELAEQQIAHALSEHQELYQHLRQAAHNFEKDLRKIISLDEAEKEISALLQQKEALLYQKIDQAELDLAEKLQSHQQNGQLLLNQLGSDFEDLKQEIEATSHSIGQHHKYLQKFGERIEIVEKAEELTIQLDQTVETLIEKLELAQSEGSRIDQYADSFEALRFNRKEIENELLAIEDQREKVAETGRQLDLVHEKLEKVEEASSLALQIEKRVAEFTAFKQVFEEYFSRIGERKKFIENALGHIEAIHRKTTNAGEAAQALLAQVERAQHRQEHLHSHLQQLESRATHLASMERNIQQVESRFEQMDGLMLDLNEKQKQIGFMSRRIDEIKALEENAIGELDSMLQESDEKMERLSALYQTVEKLIEMGTQRALETQGKEEKEEIALLNRSNRNGRKGKQPNSPLSAHKRDGILSLHLNHKWDEELIAQHLQLDRSLVRAVIASYKTVS